MFKKIVAAFAALALSISLSSCTALDGTTNGPQPTADSAVAAEFTEYYTQTVSWRSCGEAQTFCASIEVPVNWSEPAGEKLKLAVAYRKADIAEPLGSIIFNPGGPGSSGVDWITDSISQLGTEDLRSNFNLVGFDPRGVGQSEPKIKCLDSKGTDYFLYGDSGLALGSKEDIFETRQRVKKFTEACLENTGENLGFVDTVSTAKDLDVIRAVFGDAQINYLGFSYGTLIGSTYAELFTERVGRMVLDGAINPLVSDAEQSVLQLKGFDQALKNYLTDCLSSSDCPFSGTVVDAEIRITKLLRQLELNQLPTDSGRELTIWGAVTGLIMPLYSKSWWPALSQAFTEALQGDGTTFLEMADAYNERKQDGSYATNLMEANVSVSCLDSRQPPDDASMALQNKRVLAASPTLGRYWQFGALACEQWPFAVVKSPESYRASGSKPIVVIGTTGDPATPYSQAVQLANDVLENATLITYRGEGHTIYGQDNQCVNNAVDAYFIENIVPSEELICR